MSEVPRVEEPLHIKKFLRSVLEASDKRGKFIVFTGNRFPKYLWEAWERDLKRRGYTWQDLLHAISLVAPEVLDWVEDRMEWDRLVTHIWKTLLSMTPASSKDKGRRAKRLDEYFP